MKNNTRTQSAAAPLVSGQIIARGSISLGMGHDARYQIVYDGPSQPLPASGIAWPPEHDFPAAKITVSLPGDASSKGWDGYHYYSMYPHPDLQDTVARALWVTGEQITNTWGTGYESTADAHTPRTPMTMRRIRTDRLVSASLRDASATLLRTLRAELRPVQAHLRARAARIAQREATLAAGIAGVRAVKAPAAQ